ncbi:hypothetical protein [Gimesia sp.]|uniref:hypothetical protein n=1 Tax=Gimesia sp. TaxID=2024833 RepID=UPI003A8EF1A8
MRNILVELGKLDDVAFNDLKDEKWTEENAQALENNPYIYKAIVDAYGNMIHSSAATKFQKNSNARLCPVLL